MASFSSSSPSVWGGAALLAVCLTATPTPAALDPQDAAGRVVDPALGASLLLKSPAPEYPPLARVNYIQGRVRVELSVSREGKVSEAHVVRGHPFLAVAALKAIRRWIYRPFNPGSGPEPFSTVIEVNFSLQPRNPLEPLPPDPEKDLGARVQPPVALDPPPESPSASRVVVRVLVDSEGHPLDVRPVSGISHDFEEAQKLVRGWTFRPARWGALAVPWYLDVTVPVGHWAGPGGAAGPVEP